jgi:hypothetical protein
LVDLVCLVYFVCFVKSPSFPLYKRGM